MLIVNNPIVKMNTPYITGETSVNGSRGVHKDKSHFGITGLVICIAVANAKEFCLFLFMAVVWPKPEWVIPNFASLI